MRALLVFFAAALAAGCGASESGDQTPGERQNADPAVMTAGDEGLPPGGRHVDVGAFDMFLRCTGEGSPTVVLEAGAGLDSADWKAVQAGAQGIARVCSYDRAGQGRSEAPPEQSGDAELSTSAVVEQLHMLLYEAGIDPPFVLVGHSMGGMYVRLYELAYPDDAVGMVLVDAVRRERGLTPGSLGEMPLVVLMAALSSVEGTRDPWIDDQRELAQLSSNSVLVSAEKSGHFIEQDQPAIIVEAIRQVLAAVRTDSKLPPCEETFPRVDGECLSG